MHIALLIGSEDLEHNLLSLSRMYKNNERSGKMAPKCTARYQLGTKALFLLSFILFISPLFGQETVLSEVPGAGTGFRQQFPMRTVYDIDYKIYNLTTPYAAEKLGQMVRGLDVPLTGKKLGVPIYIVDGPGFYTSVEASPRGPILIHRRYLEYMTGVRIKGRSQSSVNAAVRALINNPAQKRAMESIIAHELGHQTQAHGRFTPRTGFAAAAQDKVNFVRSRLDRISFHQRFSAECNDYVNKAYNRYYESQGRASYQLQYDADVSRLREGLKQKGNLRDAISFLNLKNPPKVDSRVTPSRSLRILKLTEFIERNPQEFGRYLDGRGATIKVRQGTEIKITKSNGGIIVNGRTAVIDGFMPSRPSISSHIHEYMADEHSLLSRYLKSKDLRGSMALFNKLGQEPGKGVGLRDSHPSKGARILNAISYVEAHPEIFKDGLKKPIHFRVCRDLPAVKVEMVNGKVKVTGREAVLQRLAKPEQSLFTEYVKARRSYGKRVNGWLNRRLLPKSRKYYATEPYVLEAFGKGRAEGAPGKKWAEGKWWRPDQKASRLRAEASRNGQPKGEKPARLTQQLITQEAAKQKGKPRRTLVRGAANGFSKTASTLFTIMLMNAAAQYHQNGSVDMEAAIKHTLDSPEIWGGIGAAALIDRATVNAQRQMLSSQASRSMFSKALNASKGCIIAMVTFEVVGAYVRQASKGIDGGADGHLSITEMFSGKGERGKHFLKNLGKIMLSPKAHAEVLGHVLKDRLLTFEFGFTVAGMVAGAKAGAIGLGTAGALLGPVGATVLGAVGGLVGGIVGGLGGAMVGAWIDEKVNGARYSSSLSKTKELLQEGPKKDTGLKKLWNRAFNNHKSDRQLHKERLTDSFKKNDKLRRKLVEAKTKKLIRVLGKMKKASAKEVDELEKEVKELRKEIQDLYLDELDLLAKNIDGDKMHLGANFYVERENAVFSELVMSTSQVDDLANQVKRAVHKKLGRETIEGRQQSSPNYKGLSLG